MTKEAPARPSVTYSALIWFGMVLCALGAVMCVLGIGHAVQFSAKAGEAEMTTTSSGLALVGIGATLAGTVATRLPQGVQLFGLHERTLLDRIADRALPLLLIGCAAILGVLWMVFHHR